MEVRCTHYSLPPPDYHHYHQPPPTDNDDDDPPTIIIIDNPNWIFWLRYCIHIPILYNFRQVQFCYSVFLTWVDKLQRILCI